jgi:hypothetical protein
MSSITLKDVDKAVCIAFATTPERLRGRRRAREFVEPRFAFYHLARTIAGRSFPQIGNYLHRDHTTVIHGLCRSAKLLDQGEERYSPRYIAAVDLLTGPNAMRERRSIRLELAPALPFDLGATG